MESLNFYDQMNKWWEGPAWPGTKDGTLNYKSKSNQKTLVNLERRLNLFMTGMTQYNKSQTKQSLYKIFNYFLYQKFD